MTVAEFMLKDPLNAIKKRPASAKLHDWITDAELLEALLLARPEKFDGCFDIMARALARPEAAARGQRRAHARAFRERLVRFSEDPFMADGLAMPILRLDRLYEMYVLRSLLSGLRGLGFEPASTDVISKAEAKREASLEAKKLAEADGSSADHSTVKRSVGAADELASTVIRIIELSSGQSYEDLFDARRCLVEINIGKSLLRRSKAKGYRPIEAQGEQLFFCASRRPDHAPKLARHLKKLEG